MNIIDVTTKEFLVIFFIGVQDKTLLFLYKLLA